MSPNSRPPPIVDPAAVTMWSRGTPFRGSRFLFSLQRRACLPRRGRVPRGSVLATTARLLRLGAWLRTVISLAIQYVPSISPQNFRRESPRWRGSLQLGRPPGAWRCSWRGRCDERGAADLHSRRQHQLANLLPGAPPPCGPLVTRPLVIRDGPCLAGRPACAPIPCVRLPRHVRADAHQRAPPLSLTPRRCSRLIPPQHHHRHALTLLTRRAVCAA